MKYIKSKIETACDVMVYTLLLCLFGLGYVLVSLYIDQCPVSTVTVIISPFAALLMLRVCDAIFEFINGNDALTLVEKQCALLINCVFMVIMGEMFAYIWDPACHKLSGFVWNLCIGSFINVSDMISGKSFYQLLKEYCVGLIDFGRNHLLEMAVSTGALMIVTALVLLQHYEIFEHIMTFSIAVMLLTVDVECLYIYCIHITREIPGGPVPQRKRY